MKTAIGYINYLKNVRHKATLKMDLNNGDGMPLSNVLVKIHGSRPIEKEVAGELVVTIKALAKTEGAFRGLPNWRKYLLDLISNKIVVVMGYSCSDDFDIVPLLAESKPKEVIWLNYDNNNCMPVFTHEIANTNINELAKNIPILYYNGRLVPFLLEWSRRVPFCLHEGELESQFTVKKYILQHYKTEAEKYVLCNEIFLSYGLYNEVVVFGDNLQLHLQKIKSEFRLKNYVFHGAPFPEDFIPHYVTLLKGIMRYNSYSLPVLF